MSRSPSYPWVWLYNRDLAGLREKFAALDRNEFEGYCLWLVGAGHDHRRFAGDARHLLRAT